MTLVRVLNVAAALTFTLGALALAGRAQALPRAGAGQMCGGIAGIGCAKGLWCEYEAGRCRMPDASGRCVRAPQVCTMQYQPVCGCDGRTYGNTCARQGRRVSLKHVGACGKDTGKRKR